MSLVAGDEAWHIVTSEDGQRRKLLGAARVRVLSVDGETLRVEVLRASGAVVGSTIVCARWGLYDVRSPDEHAAFGAEVRRYWSAA